MHDIAIPFPAVVILRAAVALVWFYEGLWCKLLGKTPSQVQVVTAVPKLGALVGPLFLKTLGVVEVGIAVWVMWGIAPGTCAVVQTGLLVGLNINGLLWARNLIHEPLGMVAKNLAFLTLAWVCGSVGGVRP